MLKHAAHVCLIAVLVAGGVILGYQNGLATARRPGDLNGQSMASGAGTATPVPTAIELMQSTAAPRQTLDSSAKSALFGIADVANQHLVITGSQPISKDFDGRGNFNFNIGYQF